MLRKLSLFLVLGSFLTTLGCGIPEIAGTITEDGEGLEGVTVTLTGPTSQSTTTDNNGTYSFTDLELGSYTVTPSLDLYRFVPEYTTVDVTYAFLGAPVDGIDFVGESGPDLIVSNVTVSDATSGYIEYDFFIKNIGTVPVDLGPSGPAVAIQAVLSNDDVFNNDDDVWACGKRLTGVLNPGETLPSSYHCYNVDPYSFTYLVLMVDFDINGNDLVDELDETNNTNVAEVFASTELIPASLLTVDTGESVTYAGPNPADDGATIMTITFNGDGTMLKNWILPVLGEADCPGTWSYDGTEMTMVHVCLGLLTTTEIFEAAFIYDGGNKLDLYSPIQDDPGDGSLLVGEYSLDSDVHTVLPGLVDMTVDATQLTTVGDDGTWTSVTTTVYVGDPQHDPADWTDIQTTEGTWGFADNWLFELDGEYLVQVDDSMVLTRQP